MLQNFMLSAKNWQKILINLLIFLFVCIASLGFLLCIGAFVIIRIDTPEYVLIPLTTTLVTFASFLDSFLLAKVLKENGMLIGLMVGGIFAVIIIGIAVFYQTFAFSNLLITKLMAVLLAGILGGILGVNT